MKASVLDLRYKMKDVLKALDRNEMVEILYHGIIKGRIMPTRRKSDKKVVDHAFFGMKKGDKASISEQMSMLRGGDK